MDKKQHKLTRSEHMARIKRAGNKSTEVKLQMLLVREKIRDWKIQPKSLIGKPDFIFPKKKVAVFVDGCFWHGCPKCGHLPKSNQIYWKNKILGNRRRDKQRTAQLRQQEWKVLRLWEHELNDLQLASKKVVSALT